MAKLKSIDDLKFDEHNFNKHTKDGMSLLEKSVREHNFGRSILVDKDNNIIAGNGIVETAKKLDKTKIKVVETTGDELVVVKRTDVDINSKAGREMALADNATSANDLAWNEEELALAEKMWDVDIAGWGVDSFKEELDAYREAEEDGYAENDNVIEPVVKNGELWQLGEHRLYCGDSTKITDIQTLMGGWLQIYALQTRRIMSTTNQQMGNLSQMTIWETMLLFSSLLIHLSIYLKFSRMAVLFTSGTQIRKG